MNIIGVNKEAWEETKQAVDTGNADWDLRNLGWGDLFTIEEYNEMVNSTMLIDYDGFGKAIDNNGDILGEVKPSSIDQLPEGTKYVLWYNR